MNVGQILYFARNRHSGALVEMKITRIGSKWISVRYPTQHEDTVHYKLDKHTLVADGGRYSSPGRAYLTKEAYEREVTLNASWAGFRHCIDATLRPPAGLTTEAIQRAYEILGFNKV